MISTSSIWIIITICVYWLSLHIHRNMNNTPFFPPILISIMLLVTLLLLSRTSYQSYFQGSEVLTLFLGPTIVTLAIPLYRHVHIIKHHVVPIFLAVVLGSSATIITAMLLAYFFIDGSAMMDIIKTLATKSVTTPVAISIADEVNAMPALASTFVMITGVLGAVMAPFILKRLHIDEPHSIGITLGVCAHAIGTSRAIELGHTHTAYSTLGMIITASIHAMILPWLINSFL
jgi:predicted murein hydrolase (TIGR00659 family)